MKNVILISFLLGLFAASAFSQDKVSLKLDTTGFNMSAYVDIGKYSQMSKQHEMIDPTLAELNKQLKEKTQVNRLKNAQNSLDILQNNKSYDNMPCLKPMLTEAMPCLKPDSTIFYHLRIKKVK